MTRSISDFISVALAFYLFVHPGSVFALGDPKADAIELKILREKMNSEQNPKVKEDLARQIDGIEKMVSDYASEEYKADFNTALNGPSSASSETEKIFYDLSKKDPKNMSTSDLQSNLFGLALTGFGGPGAFGAHSQYKDLGDKWAQELQRRKDAGEDLTQSDFYKSMRRFFGPPTFASDAPAPDEPAQGFGGLTLHLKPQTYTPVPYSPVSKWTDSEVLDILKDELWGDWDDWEMLDDKTYHDLVKEAKARHDAGRFNLFEELGPYDTYMVIRHASYPSPVFFISSSVIRLEAFYVDNRIKKSESASPVAENTDQGIHYFSPKLEGFKSGYAYEPLGKEEKPSQGYYPGFSPDTKWRLSSGLRLGYDIHKAESLGGENNHIKSLSDAELESEFWKESMSEANRLRWKPLSTAFGPQTRADELEAEMIARGLRKRETSPADNGNYQYPVGMTPYGQSVSGGYAPSETEQSQSRGAADGDIYEKQNYFKSQNEKKEADKNRDWNTYMNYQPSFLNNSYSDFGAPVVKPLVRELDRSSPGGSGSSSSSTSEPQSSSSTSACSVCGKAGCSPARHK